MLKFYNLINHSWEKSVMTPECGFHLFPLRLFRMGLVDGFAYLEVVARDVDGFQARELLSRRWRHARPSRATIRFDGLFGLRTTLQMRIPSKMILLR